MRFYFQEPSPAEKLIADADRLKIEVIRVGNRTCATYEIQGSLGSPFADDEDETPEPPADVRGFVEGLLEAFGVKGGDV